MVILLSFVLSSPIFAQSFCNAPGQAFMEKKFKETFKLQEAEKELKEVVLAEENYSLREDVRSLQRRLLDAKRMDREPLLTEITARFDQMIVKSKRKEPIINFPQIGSMSQVTTSDDHSIMLAVRDLTTEDLSFLPDEVLKKVGGQVRVRYYYPIDRFEYDLTYDGEEMPMTKAFHQMQDDFEKTCSSQVEENYEIREAKKVDWKDRKYDMPEKTSGGVVGK
jgi:hypothetical protein